MRLNCFEVNGYADGAGPVAGVAAGVGVVELPGAVCDAGAAAGVEVVCADPVVGVPLAVGEVLETPPAGSAVVEPTAPFDPEFTVVDGIGVALPVNFFADFHSANNGVLAASVTSMIESSTLTAAWPRSTSALIPAVAPDCLFFVAPLFVRAVR